MSNIASVYSSAKAVETGLIHVRRDSGSARRLAELDGVVVHAVIVPRR